MPISADDFLDKKPVYFDDDVRAAAEKYGLDPELAVLVHHQEYNPAQWYGSSGEAGPGQLMPGTAKRLGVDPNDPIQNIDGSVRYLKSLLDTHKGDVDLALASYNAGPGAVKKYGGIPPYKVTQDYVKKIGGKYRAFKQFDSFLGEGGTPVEQPAAAPSPRPRDEVSKQFDDFLDMPSIQQAPEQTETEKMLAAAKPYLPDVNPLGMMQGDPRVGTITAEDRAAFAPGEYHADVPTEMPRQPSQEPTMPRYTGDVAVTEQPAQAQQPLPYGQEPIESDLRSTTDTTSATLGMQGGTGEAFKRTAEAADVALGGPPYRAIMHGGAVPMATAESFPNEIPVMGPAAAIGETARVGAQKLEDAGAPIRFYPGLTGDFNLPTKVSDIQGQVVDPQIVGAVAEMGVDLAAYPFLAKVVLGASAPFRQALDKILTTALWRQIGSKERALVVQSLEETIKRNPDMTEGEILKRWNNPTFYEEAMTRRGAGSAPGEPPPAVGPVEPAPPPTGGPPAGPLPPQPGPVAPPEPPIATVPPTAAPAEPVAPAAPVAAPTAVPEAPAPTVPVDKQAATNQQFDDFLDGAISEEELGAPAAPHSTEAVPVGKPYGPEPLTRPAKPVLGIPEKTGEEAGQEAVAESEAPEQAPTAHGKEAWEMTRDEFMGPEMAVQYPITPDGKAFDPELMPKAWKYFPITKEALKHKNIIRQALAANKPVPANVLADYPDLAKLAGEKGKAEAPDVAANDDRARKIETIITDSQKPIPQIVPSVRLKGSDGEWYGIGGFPEGVKNTGEKRTDGYVYLSSDGTPVGKRFATEEEARNAAESRKRFNDAELRRELEGFSDERLQEFYDFWVKRVSRKEEAAKAVEEIGKREEPKPLGTGSTENDARLARLREKKKTGRGMTASDEKVLELYEAQAKADPGKWNVGDGVGWRVDRQINRGYRIAEINPDRKQAKVIPVRDTGLTLTGGGMEGIGPSWVHVADLVKDRKSDATNIKQSAGAPAEPPTLGPAQAAFVEKKVRELGSVQAVNDFYPGESKVDRYAREMAPQWLGEGVKANDQENVSGIPSEIGKGQEPVQAESQQGAGGKEAGGSGNVQVNEREEVGKESADTFQIDEKYIDDIPASARDDVLTEVKRIMASISRDNEGLYNHNMSVLQGSVMMFLRRAGMDNGSARKLKDRLLAPIINFEGKQEPAAQGAVAGRIFTHFTTAEGKAALESGKSFDFTKEPQHGTGSLGNEKKLGRFAGNRLYLSTDGKAWGEVLRETGEGKTVEATAENAKQGVPYYDYEAQKWMVTIGGHKTEQLHPVGYKIANNARVLTISTDEELKAAVKEATALDGKRHFPLDDETLWDALAKSYDVVEIRNVKENIKNTDSKFWRAIKADQLIVLNPDVATVVTPTTKEPPAPKVEQGKPATAYTPDNKPVELHYQVMDAQALISSHDENGRVNQAYPAELQPRDRKRIISRIQIQKMAGNLNPELLGESAKIGDGAPIVGPDAVVESGNGRVAAIRMAYQNQTAGPYKEWLAKNADKFGLDAKAVGEMTAPVLVRVRDSKVSRADFARQANQSTMAEMGASEQARMDAGRITADHIDLFNVPEDGNIMAASNRPFVKRFMELLSDEEAGNYLTGAGQYGKKLGDRIQAAIFEKAYHDDRLLGLAAEEANPDIKNILTALTLAAPEFARARMLGMPAEIDITPHISEAAALIQKANQMGTTIDTLLGQQTMFAKISPEGAWIAKFVMDANKRRAKRMGDILSEMGRVVTSELKRDKNKEMFARPALTRQALINAAEKRAEALNGEIKGSQQTLFGKGTGKGRESLRGPARTEGETGATTAEPTTATATDEPKVTSDLPASSLDYTREDVTALQAARADVLADPAKYRDKGYNRRQIDGIVRAVEQGKELTPEQKTVADDLIEMKYGEYEDVVAQSAFHGSPYKFGQFSLDHIGSGEGAQAFGFGHYAAGRKELAQWYRDKLGKTIFTELTEEENAAIPEWVKESIARQTSSAEKMEETDANIYEFTKRLDDARLMAKTSTQPWLYETRIESHKETLSALEKLIKDKNFDLAKKGHLYEVDIPADEDLLDWDRPLSEQSEKVEGILRPYLETLVPASDINQFERYGGKLLKESTAPLRWTGETLYRHISRDLGSAQAASDYLASIGIPGHRFLDAASRKQGEGHHNYVIYQDKDINILKVEQPRRPMESTNAPQTKARKNAALVMQAERAPAPHLITSFREPAGRVGDTAETLRGSVTTLGKAIAADLKATGQIDLRGKVAATSLEKAQLCQQLRNAKWETFYILYHDADGKVLDYEGISQRLPDAASVFMGNRRTGLAHIRDRIDTLGAKTVTMVHNHPDRKMEASKEDANTTQMIFDAIPEANEHIIINGKEYVVITRGKSTGIASWEVKPLPKPPAWVDPLHVPEKPHALLHKDANNTERVAEIAKQAQVDATMPVILHVGASLKVRGIQVIDRVALDSAPYNELVLFFQEQARNFGATEMFLYDPVPLQPGEGRVKLYRQLFDNHVFLDISTPEQAYYEHYGTPEHAAERDKYWVGQERGTFPKERVAQELKEFAQPDDIPLADVEKAITNNPDILAVPTKPYGSGSPQGKMTGKVRGEVEDALTAVSSFIHPKRATFLSTLLQSPGYRSDPNEKAAFEAGALNRDARKHEIFNDHIAPIDTLAALKKTSKEEYGQVVAILERLDVTGRKWDEVRDNIIEGGVSPQVIEAVDTTRENYDALLDLQRKSVKDLIDEMDAKKVDFVDVPIQHKKAPAKRFYQAELQLLKQDQKTDSLDAIINGDEMQTHGEVEIPGGGQKFTASQLMLLKERFHTDSLAEIIAEIAKNKSGAVDIPITFTRYTKSELLNMYNEMGSLKGSYSPRIRGGGGWFVTYKDAKGLLWRNHYMSEWTALRGVRKAKVEGATNVEYGENSRLPDTIYQDLDIIDMGQAMETAVEQSGVASPEVKALVRSQILLSASNILKERGFRQRKIRRRSDVVVHGYETDPLHRYATNLNQVAGGISKGEAAMKMYSALMNVNAVHDAKRYERLRTYIEDNLRNSDSWDVGIGLAKSLVSFKYLTSLRSGLVNTIAVVTTAPSAILHYALEDKGSLLGINRAIAKAGKDYSGVMVGRKLANVEEQAFLDDERRSGHDLPQLTRDAMAHIQGAFGRAWTRNMNYHMWIFGKTEQWNRGTTLLAAYRLARKQGKEIEKAKELAQLATRRAHGDYGKGTKPALAQGGNVIAKISQMSYGFMTFPHNYLQMLYEHGINKKTAKGLVYAMIAPAVVAGPKAFIGYKALLLLAALIFKATGDDRDPEKVLMDKIRNTLGKRAENTARLGLTGGALGVDISGSLAIGFELPRNLSDIFGPFGGVYTDVTRAGKYLMEGEKVRAVEQMLPSVYANPVKAARERVTGTRTMAGNLVKTEDGLPYIPDNYDTIKRVIGFKSADQSVAQERSLEAKEEKRRFGKEAREDAADRKKIMDNWRVKITRNPAAVNELDTATDLTRSERKELRMESTGTAADRNLKGTPIKTAIAMWDAADERKQREMLRAMRHKIYVTYKSNPERFVEVQSEAKRVLDEINKLEGRTATK